MLWIFFFSDIKDEAENESGVVIVNPKKRKLPTQSTNRAEECKPKVQEKKEKKIKKRDRGTYKDDGKWKTIPVTEVLRTQVLDRAKQVRRKKFRDLWFFMQLPIPTRWQSTRSPHISTFDTASTDQLHDLLEDMIPQLSEKQVRDTFRFLCVYAHEQQQEENRLSMEMKKMEKKQKEEARKERMKSIVYCICRYVFVLFGFPYVFFFFYSLRSSMPLVIYFCV